MYKVRRTHELQLNKTHELRLVVLGAAGGAFLTLTGLLLATKKPAPVTAAPADPPSDFLLEWYKLHREHELELNKATLAYELELAKLLVLLNGAAAGAFLTLTGAIWKDGSRPAFVFFAAAIGSWLAGLLTAALVTNYAYEAQREYTRAYRFRRQGEEQRRIDGTGIEREHLGIGAEPLEKADRALKRAKGWQKTVRKLRPWPVVFFVLGGIFALSAFFPSLHASKPIAD